MNVRSIHPWNLPPKEAIALQRQLAQKIDLSTNIDLDRLNLIGGVDVSASRFSTFLTAGIVVWDRLTGKLVDSVYAQATQEFPYIPGLLSFREIPIIVEALRAVTTLPDALLVDGQGVAHPRRLGIAAHLGLLVDIPTVGVAKSRLTGAHAPLPPDTGAQVALTDGDEIIGTVLRSKRRSNPLFVSPGNHIDHASALALVRACTRDYRLPEPTRLAHVYVNDMRKKHQPSLL